MMKLIFVFDLEEIDLQLIRRSFILRTYHELHVGGRRVDLTPQLVVKVQDQVHVSFADGPLPSGPDLPPLLIFVPVLVEDGLEICRVVEDHSQDGLGQAQE